MENSWQMTMFSKASHSKSHLNYLGKIPTQKCAAYKNIKPTPVSAAGSLALGGMEAESATVGRNRAKEEEVKKHHASFGRNVRRLSFEWSAESSHIHGVGMVASKPASGSLVVGSPKFSAPCSSAVRVLSLLIRLTCTSLFRR
jgi:hypothetical protein